MLLCIASAHAQQVPAPTKPAAKSAAPADEGVLGTTIVGDREAPIGLYLTPWKNEHPDGSERPAQFLKEELGPIDPPAFKRLVVYFDMVTTNRQLELDAKK